MLKSLKKYKGKPGKRGKAAEHPQRNRLWCESQQLPQRDRLWCASQKLPQLTHLWCEGRVLHRPRRVAESLNIVALLPCQKSWAAGVSLAMGLSVAATAMPQISLVHSARSSACLARGPRPISHHEAKLRLKRWFAAGQFLERGWPAGQQRAHHLKAVGTSLFLFATGEPGWSEMSEDELNEACRMVPPAV